MEKPDVAIEVLASGDRVILRDRLPSDVDSYLRWRTLGEWRRYDAPWEGVCTAMTVEEIATFRMRVAEKLGFVYEGAQRELVEWQGKRLDLVHYGMLRREWEERVIRGQWKSDSTTLLQETGHQTLRLAQDRRRTARGESN